MNALFTLLMALVAIKALFIGSEYNFGKRLKEGKEYTKKYNEWLKNKP